MAVIKDWRELAIEWVDLPNFQAVSPTLFRGGQPSHKGFIKLKSLGVKTIINLRDEAGLVGEEEMLLGKLSLTHVSIPLSPFSAPPEVSISRFLSLSTDEDAHPCFVHCLHGQDRTGTFVGLYRLHVQGWSLEKTYAEMLDMGFHPHFSNLEDAVVAFANSKSMDRA